MRDRAHRPEQHMPHACWGYRSCGKAINRDVQPWNGNQKVLLEAPSRNPMLQSANLLRFARIAVSKAPCTMSCLKTAAMACHGIKSRGSRAQHAHTKSAPLVLPPSVLQEKEPAAKTVAHI